MDSTTVALITSTARDLGITAGTAFGWWLIAKIAGNVIWAIFATFLVWRVTSLIARMGQGQRFISAVARAAGHHRDYLGADDFDRAMHIIAENWRKK